MRNILLHLVLLIAASASALSCAEYHDPYEASPSGEKKEVAFPVRVTRDGQDIPQAAITKGGMVEESDKIATMEKSLPVGLVGVDFKTGALLLDNKMVSYYNGMYRGQFDSSLWEVPAVISLSAYYPRVNSLSYGEENKSYSIPFGDTEREAGPLVSKTVQCAVDQLDLVPLEFQHITNDIGFKICDVTSDPDLQGLIHLRKLTANCVASAGVFVNDMEFGYGFWHHRGYYRDEVVFEGDSRVGVGMENEKFVGRDALVSRMADSYRFYAIPDELEVGKQYVEVVFDIDDFVHNNFHYDALKDQKVKYMLYGVLPENKMAYGKQYTFHLGLDVGKIYNEITFAPSVSDWETKIYENNDEF